jgi:hypothetical protein
MYGLTAITGAMGKPSDQKMVVRAIKTVKLFLKTLFALAMFFYLLFIYQI